ncbi:hypothetical protein SH449x_002163 [Pirellulaceae bacterium SH449]
MPSSALVTCHTQSEYASDITLSYHKGLQHSAGVRVQATIFRYHWLVQWSFMFLANTMAPPALPPLCSAALPPSKEGGAGPERLCSEKRNNPPGKREPFQRHDARRVTPVLSPVHGLIEACKELAMAVAR